jgi:hypothetical protein
MLEPFDFVAIDEIQPFVEGTLLFQIDADSTQPSLPFSWILFQKERDISLHYSFRLSGTGINFDLVHKMSECYYEGYES